MGALISESKRIEWIDAARGIGIILVVLGHVNRGLMDAKLAHSPGLVILDYVLYCFHMPLFFVLAGINTPHSLSKPVASFVWAKCASLVYPYVLWSVIQESIFALFASYSNTPVGWKNIAEIGIKPLAQFWFLYILFLLQMIIIPFKKHPRIFFVLSLVLFSVSPLLSGLIIVKSLTHFILFFAVGVALPYVLDLSKWQLTRLQTALTGIVFCLSAYAGFSLQSSPDPMSPFALPAALSGTLLVIGIVQQIPKNVLKIFCQLGIASMTIYVLHILASTGTRLILSKSHLPVNEWFYLVFGTSAGLAIPYAFHQYLQKQNWLSYLGLGSRKKRVAPVS